jgi:hypothetical protein
VLSFARLPVGPTKSRQSFGLIFLVTGNIKYRSRAAGWFLAFFQAFRGSSSWAGYGYIEASLKLPSVVLGGQCNRGPALLPWTSLGGERDSSCNGARFGKG